MRRQFPSQSHDATIEARLGVIVLAYRFKNDSE